MNHILALWKSEYLRPTFRRQAIGTLLGLVLTLMVFTRFLDWVEVRSGVVLDDPLLKLFSPIDLTWLIFGIIYIGIVMAIGHLATDPRRLIIAVQSYALMVWVRMLMMYLMPLDPPERLIVLQDPLVQLVGSGAAPTRDLFFSGHTSTLALLALMMDDKTWRRLYYVFATVVAIAIVAQHVHYAIDVVVAPFVAYAVSRFVKKRHKVW